MSRAKARISAADRKRRTRRLILADRVPSSSA